MAVLKCRHCQGAINSTSRRVQCPHCAQLFPFQCETCDRNLRPPFAVFDDERHLTLDEENPKPLCDEHYLRLCPDCKTWYQASENPGFFRCPACHEKAMNAAKAPVVEERRYEEVSDDSGEVDSDSTPAPAKSGIGCSSTACVMLGIVVWFLMKQI